MSGVAALTWREIGNWLLGTEGIAKDGDVRLEWDFLPAAWVLVLVLLPAACGLAFLFYRTERKDVGVGAKIFLAGFRAVLLLLVLFMVFGPKLAVYTIVREWSYVIILVDDSSSMGKADAYVSPGDRHRIAKVMGVGDDEPLTPEQERQLQGVTRAQIVRRALENGKIHLLEDLEAKLNVRYYTFSSRPVSFEERRGEFLKAYENPTGTETAIGEAIRQAVQKEHSVVGVVVVSDFKNNAGVDPEEVARQCRQQYIPVYTVLAGIPQTPRNLALLEPEGTAAVLAGGDYKLDFKVRATGYEKEDLQVEVWLYPRDKENREIPGDPEAIEKLLPGAIKLLDHPVKLLGTEEKQGETVVFKHQTPGEYFVILKIEPRPEESTRNDNYLVHPLRIADDHIKVLYVEHPPRYEYRFLKNALIRDDKILCHVFLTSADTDFPQEHTRNAKDPWFKEPLKEFPKTRELLFQYDVLILGDVDPARLGGEEVWENIEAFVTEFGGGLILISGQNNPRLFLDKPALRGLVPVELEPPKSESEPVYDKSYGYVLTAQARGKDDRSPHPIIYYRQFAQAGAPEKNVEHWEDRDGRGDGQMGVYWFVRTKRLELNASALIEVAGAQTGEGKRYPLFVTQYNGRGRVFWAGTDETWRWRYCTGDYPWFYPFWQQAMYWVREGKLLGAKRYRISVDKERYNLGEKIKISANAYDEKFQKRTDKILKIQIVPPSGPAESVELRKDPARDGYYEGEYLPRDPGAYKAWAGDEGDKSDRAEARFLVHLPTREEEEPFLQPGAAKRIADASYEAQKGRSQYFTIDRIAELTGDVKSSPRNMRTPQRPRYLWSSPAVWILFTVLITLEWVLRKIWRML